MAAVALDAHCYNYWDRFLYASRPDRRTFDGRSRGLMLERIKAWMNYILANFRENLLRCGGKQRGHTRPVSTGLRDDGAKWSRFPVLPNRASLEGDVAKYFVVRRFPGDSGSIVDSRLKKEFEKT